MSVPSSVASSYASLDGPTTQQPDQPSAASSDCEDLYSDDISRTSNYGEEQTSRPPSGDEPDLEESHIGEDYYDDDAFELAEDGEVEVEVEVEAAAADIDAVEYSDDWDHDVSAGVQKIDASACDGVLRREDVVAPHAEPLEQVIQHPNNNLENCTEDWAREKKLFLSQCERIARSRIPRSSRLREVSSVEIDPDTAAVLIRRVRKRRMFGKYEVIASHNHGPRLPTQLVERVNLQKLLALSTQYPPPAVAHVERASSQSRSLSTFCSVKAANLQGKLATDRLHEMCARWHVSATHDNTMSIATSEFVASMVTRQRHVLRSNDPNSSVLGALKTFATGLDRAVETATLAVNDTKALVQDAQRILQAPDAHICRCKNGSPSTAAV